ncbi:hypothetical protein DPMN_141591 [Dreissena polymorpha]|uniref:Uncharacterized protein n=1 Tax=Dreissena polymorpha TaxID=45954 RepID=A0A9D4JHU3_DREPO|nr:hypothetical protein DPMN_141591 [Dreissena polymorpha]
MKCTNCGKDGSEPQCAECHAKKEPDVYCKDIEGEKGTVELINAQCVICARQTNTFAVDRL